MSNREKLDNQGKIITNISPIKRYIYNATERTFQPKKFDKIALENRVLASAWFDVLFHSGIKTLRDNPITMVIQGAPGSGKSTLAMEIC